MKRILCRTSIVCLWSIIALLSLPAAFGRTIQQVDLLDRPIELNLSNASVSDVLMKLSVEHDIAIGFEYSSLDHDQPKVNIDLKSGKLRDVLDLIVKQVPLYRWELRDGVINFIPTQGRDPFLEKLLDLRISRYLPKKGINKFELRNTLADLPEVRRLLESANVNVIRVSDYIYRPSIYANDGVDLSVSDTDVRGVLNKIAGKSEHNLWVVGWQDKKKRSLALGF